MVHLIKYFYNNQFSFPKSLMKIMAILHLKPLECTNLVKEKIIFEQDNKKDIIVDFSSFTSSSNSISSSSSNEFNTALIIADDFNETLVGDVVWSTFIVIIYRIENTYFL